ncbi:MAG: hypothetical protein KC621_28280 [Myxococcales bacterium]|nr:hypothetical protein [Myxococcales bacterium]
MATAAMVEKGECGYCGAALPKPAQKADPPKVVHVTKVEIHGTDVDVGRVAGSVFDSITARVAGCFTGCLSTGISLVIIGFVFAMIAWQTWVQTKSFPTPSVGTPTPTAPAPGPTPRRGKRK